MVPALPTGRGGDGPTFLRRRGAGLLQRCVRLGLLLPGSFAPATVNVDDGIDFVATETATIAASVQIATIKTQEAAAKFDWSSEEGSDIVIIRDRLLRMIISKFP